MKRDSQATGEHIFLRERLNLVEGWLSNPDRQFVPAGREKVRARTRPATNGNVTYKREARLLHKLLVRTREGQVLITMQAWRPQGNSNPCRRLERAVEILHPVEALLHRRPHTEQEGGDTLNDPPALVGGVPLEQIVSSLRTDVK